MRFLAVVGGQSEPADRVSQDWGTAGYTAKIVSNWVNRWIVQHTVQLSEKCGLCAG